MYLCHMHGNVGVLSPLLCPEVKSRPLWKLDYEKLRCRMVFLPDSKAKEDPYSNNWINLHWYQYQMTVLPNAMGGQALSFENSTHNSQIYSCT
jgi:hypothetical protein